MVEGKKVDHINVHHYKISEQAFGRKKKNWPREYSMNVYLYPIFGWIKINVIKLIG